MTLVRFRFLTTYPFRFKAYRQESFLLLLFLLLPHSLSTHTLVSIPVIQHASMTLSAEAPSLELTSLAKRHLFSVGFLPETELIYQFPFPHFSPATLPPFCSPRPSSPCCLRAFARVVSSTQNTLLSDTHRTTYVIFIRSLLKCHFSLCLSWISYLRCQSLQHTHTHFLYSLP